MGDQMSASALMTRIVNAVTSAQITQGQAQLYQPLLEFIIIQVLTELSTDSAISGADQTVFTSALALATGDPTP